MGRPRGEITTTLLAVLAEFNQAGHQPTLRELAYRAQVSLKHTRYSIGSLVRARHVEIQGFKRVPYRNRPVALYGLPPAGADAAQTTQALADAMGAWR